MGILEKIWVPKSAKPRYQCNVCGETFHENESVAWEQHVVKCARRHHDTLVEAYETARPPVLYKPFDPEYAAWAKKHQRIG